MDKAYMESVQNALVHTYNPAPIVLDHGEGAYLYDTEGKAYLDFAAGYAVNSLGYGNEEWNQALKSQIDHLAHTSNLYYHTRTKEAAEALQQRWRGNRGSIEGFTKVCIHQKERKI